MKILDHRFHSAKVDGPDATQIQPSHWNDGHMFTGGAAGDVLTRDPTDAQYGATWTPGEMNEAWTPVDASGAGLVFTTPVGRSILAGRVVHVWASFGFPATSNNAPVTIGGLKYPNALGFTTGFYQTFGITHSLHLGQGGFLLLNPTSFAIRTNAECSGQQIIFAGAYPIS